MDISKKKVCSTCFSTNTQYIENFEHEDCFSDKDSATRKDDVVLCKDCDTLHYYEGRNLCREFYARAGKFNSAFEERNPTGEWTK